MDGSHADTLTPKQLLGGGSRRLQNIEVADLVCPPPQMWGLSRRRLGCSRLSIAQQGRALHTGAVQSGTQHMQPARQGGQKGTQCLWKVLSHLSQVRKVPKVKPRSQESTRLSTGLVSEKGESMAPPCRDVRAANSCVCKHLRAIWNHHVRCNCPHQRAGPPMRATRWPGSEESARRSVCRKPGSH